MTDHIAFLILGLGNGAVFAALGVALVVTYRSSGVINFATGAIALFAAYFFNYFRSGELFIPLPGLPVSLEFAERLPTPVAFTLALLATGFLGLLLYLLVFRPLRTAMPVRKAVASIGVMIVLQAVLARRLGTRPAIVEGILPQERWTIFGSTVPSDRIWFAVAIVLLAVALAALSRFTRFGLQVQAAAETERGALLSGVSPERVAAASWFIGAVVAGIAGILIAPIVPLVPVAYTLFIVPALASALAGNFNSLLPCAGTGLVIGMLQSDLQNVQIRWSWLPDSGLPELVPLVLIVGFLLLRGRGLPERGALIRRTLGRAPRPNSLLKPAVAGAVLGLLALTQTSGTYRGSIITTMVMAVLALSLVVVTGYVGLVSLAQLTLAGVSAFALTGLSNSWNIPFPLAPILGAIVAMVVGVLVGLPALRIRGLSLAVVTLAMAVGVEAAWFLNPAFNGGASGALVEAPSVFGIDLGIGAGRNYPRIEFGLMCLVVLTAVAVGVAVLRRSRLGAAMAAVRANERAAAAAGVSVAWTKVTAFAIASFIAGLAGALLAYQQTNVSSTNFTVFLGLGVFATTFWAGIGTVLGGIIAGLLAPGGLVYVWFERVVSLGRWYEMVAGLGLVLAILINPEGIAGEIYRVIDKVRTRLRGGRERGEEIRELAISTASELDGKADAIVAGARASTDDASMPVLDIVNVTVRYGGFPAVSNVSFPVHSGRIVGLIGPNGAGKTTLMDAISGFVDCEGDIRFRDEAFNSRPPHARARAGLGRTFQSMELYDDLTVVENIAVGFNAVHGRGGNARTDVAEAGLLSTLNLDHVRETPVGDLSQGYRQMVAIARALAGAPRLLLLDEPAAGLDSRETAWLGDRLRSLSDAGLTILLVDHDMSLVLTVCDDLHVLDFGKLIASGPPVTVRADPEVKRAYLGATHTGDLASA